MPTLFALSPIEREEMENTDPSCDRCGHLESQHSDKGNESCNKCDCDGLKISRKNSAEEEMENANLRCPICLMMTLNKAELDEHMLTIHERKNAKRVFIPKNALEGTPAKFQQVVHDAKKYELVEEDEYPMGVPGWWATPLLPEEMDMGNASQAICKCGHMDDKHMSGGECETCDCKQFRKNGSVENASEWKCPSCGKDLGDKSKFISHMKGMHGESGEVAIARTRGIEDPEFGNSLETGAMAKKCSFIEPGVVMYADVGMVLVRKAALDKMANSMRGKPVINGDHREIAPEDIKNNNFDGLVDGGDNAVWYDQTDGMYHCSYQVTKPEVLANIKNGFKVSCAYKVSKWGPGGIHNNVPYEREVLDGEYTHLAIVANPRYEGVRIYNTKGAATMTLKWIKKILGADGKVMENSTDIESSKSIVNVDGKDVPMDELVNAFNEVEEKKAAAAKKALENSVPALTDTITLANGKVVTVGDLVANYTAKNKEMDEEERKKAEEEEKKMEQRKNAEEKSKMEKDHEDGKHDGDKEKENCGMCNKLKNDNGRSHFERVDELANSRRGVFVDELAEPVDGFALGRERFGSEQPAAK